MSEWRDAYFSNPRVMVAGTAAYANLRFDLDRVLSWLKSFSAPII